MKFMTPRIRTGIVVGCIVAAYIAGTSIGRALQHARLETKSAAIQSALLERPLEWQLEDADGRTYNTATPTPAWKILLIGADGCDVCTRQQIAFTHMHRTEESPAELWIASTRVALFESGDTPPAKAAMRSFRYLSIDALQPHLKTLPVLLLLDPNGIVRDASVGYSERSQQEMWERMARVIRGT